MHLSHSLRMIALASLAITIGVNTPARAYSRHQLDEAAPRDFKSPESIVQLAARKGTRHYGPNATALHQPGQRTKGEPDAMISAASHRLEDCMAIWDRDTHITKSRWREICKRQIKDIETLPDL